ncbi:hypothetical protein ACQP1O_17790 [Nocardia sp. CA-151230]
MTRVHRRGTRPGSDGEAIMTLKYPILYLPLDWWASVLAQLIYGPH